LGGAQGVWKSGDLGKGKSTKIMDKPRIWRRFSSMNLPSFSRIAGISLVFATHLLAAPPVIDDQAILENLQAAMEKSVGTEGVPSADDLAKFAKTADLIKPKVPMPQPQTPGPKTDYESLSKSVYLVGTIYKCGKCDKWHMGGSATAWCIGGDGLLVTNAHVFRGAKGGSMAVADREGNCHAVTELLGIDAASDVAVFRVKAKGLQTLRLGTSAEVGAPITIISNPAGNHFVRTEGAVSRYVKRAPAKDKEKVTWMTVTADYAKGSSGGPVFNETGEVVGMVSSTNSIYTESGPGQDKMTPKGQLQMVIRNCVPADAIRALFETEATAEKQASN
jgi:S1-C subfamily serine protease